MKKIKICVIGCGNISITRHIPSIKKNKNILLTGIISDNYTNIEKITNNTKIENLLVIDKKVDVYSQLKNSMWFNNDVDAVVIGTPPMDHYLMTKNCLLLGKHVLVEKPMMMEEDECIDVINIAKEQHLIINVMHSFQFANGIIKMEKYYNKGKLGKLNNIIEIQMTSRKRRLPIWYNELPLGLFYDEAAHFFYSAQRFGGDICVKNATALYNNNENTPSILQVQAIAGSTPVQMTMNFDSPISEWFFILLCDKKLAIYDYFKDILILINNDNQHLPKDVFRVSRQYFLSFWMGFIRNGINMIMGKLLYGHDLAINAFIESIITGVTNEKLSAELGMQVVRAMHDVINKVGKEK